LLLSFFLTSLKLSSPLDTDVNNSYNARMKKPTSLDPTLPPITFDPTLPPITLLLYEYQATLLLRALRQYKPTREEEYYHSTLLEILEMIAMEN
jgi:hypothetical protein